MNPGPSPPNRVTWMLVFASLVNGVVIYGVILLFLGRPAAPAATGAPAVLFFAAAAACLFGSMAYTRWRLRPQVPVDPGESTDPARPRADAAAFQSHSLVSLALAEAAALAGFVQGLLARNGIADYVPFAVGALAVMMFDVLPLALRFWTWFESDTRGTPSP